MGSAGTGLENMTCPACKSKTDRATLRCLRCGRDRISASRLNLGLNIGLIVALSALCCVAWLWVYV
jgi:hypothetical protein